MWAYYTTIKMKNIGDEKATKEITKLMRCCDESCILVKASKNSVKFVSYDVCSYESAFELFSRKYKNQMIGISIASIHNPYSKQPERFEDIYWRYYKGGKEILRYVRNANGKSKHYKIITKVLDYENLVLEAKVKDVIEYYGDGKDVQKFFKIGDVKKKNSKVSILYYDYISKYSKEGMCIFGDPEAKKDKRITFDGFISYFAKDELIVFKRDFMTENKKNDK